MNNLAYRNMFFLPRGEHIHFEFPMFEDHSYNTICNYKGVRSIIKHPSDNAKYVMFRTRNEDTNEVNIIGYYRVGTEYYQRTDMFDNRGFVWGFYSDEPYLIEKGAVTWEDETIKQGHRVSWRSTKWNKILNKYLNKILEHKNISDLYKNETNRLIQLFKNKKKMKEWKDYCTNVCCSQSKCSLYRQFRRYESDPNNDGSDKFTVIHYAHISNLYSRNVLDNICKIPLMKER